MSIFKDLLSKKKAISVTGLGYIGLPLALAFAKEFRVIGFDINQNRIQMMQNAIDPSRELDSKAFGDSDITFTSNPEELHNAHFHIISVPTDVDEFKIPDLAPLFQASHDVGNALKIGDYAIYESTVYPGCTEEECIPILEKQSNLKSGKDFKVGYSPERTNPGDKIRTLKNILKIVSAIDREALQEVSDVYNHIIDAGIYEAESIKVAEAAKVIENTQRDINISLMNELALIFDKLDIDTNEVIKAASTKWNFHAYKPGLVGGHCIGVDPYYLIYKAKQIGIDPLVIAAGRRVNDYIPTYLAKKVVQSLINKGVNPGEAKVLVMGVTFKENISDIRNSKVIDLVHDMMSYSIKVDTIDPYASETDMETAYGIRLLKKPNGLYDAIIVAVNHDLYKNKDKAFFSELSNGKPLIFDIKGIYNGTFLENYWKL